MRSQMRKLIVLSAILAMVCAMAGSAMAESISQMETNGPGAATLDNASGQYPVVTNILSQPGTVNGRSYTSWSFLAQDSTGSTDIFAAAGTLTALGYTPTPGDAIHATGTYSPYHQIPEVGTVTAIGSLTSGNPVAVPTLTTIPAINVPTTPENLAGYFLELDDVTISGISGIFNANTNLTGTITDGLANSMTLYYWPTSYSVENANMCGAVIPTGGPVNMTGFVSVYNGTAEFTPMAIVPEPATLVLFAVGGVCALAGRLRRRGRC